MEHERRVGCMYGTCGCVCSIAQLTRVACAARRCAHIYGGGAGAQGLVNRIGTYKTKYFEFTHVRVKTRRSLASSFRNRYRSRRPGAALLPRLPTRPFD